MVLLIIIGLTLLKVVIIKLSFMCFCSFFCIKSKTGALCLITVSLLTKPPWPSKHKMSFYQWAASCGFVFCSEPVEKWFGLWKIQALESETSNFLIYRLTLNIGNFGSNASINDAWHKKVNNMEMSSVKKVGRHLWVIPSLCFSFVLRNQKSRRFTDINAMFVFTNRCTWEF